MKPAHRQAVAELSILPDSSDDPRELSDLIGDVYDTVLDQSLWEGVIARTADFVRGTGAALYSKDVANQEGSVQYDFGIDPYYKRLYFEKYVTLDPTTTGHFFAEIEQPVATVDLMPYDEFVETRFYREWAQPQGLVDGVNAVLDKSATSVAMAKQSCREVQRLVRLARVPTVGVSARSDALTTGLQRAAISLTSS